MPIRVGAIELHVGPAQAGGPDDLRAAIVGFIDKAERRLDIAVQELDDRDIVQAILRAAARGVKVRLLLEADYLVPRRRTKSPWTAEGDGESNREAQAALLRAKVWLRTDFNPNIFHQKFIVRDGTAVLTGSTNFTPTGVTTNLNHVLIIENDVVARLFRAEFHEMRKGRFGRYSRAHTPAPPLVDVDGIPVGVAFGPTHSPEMEIVKQMLKAKSRVDFAVFTFAQSSAIDDAMIALGNLGLRVRGVLDRQQANQKWPLRARCTMPGPSCS